jgi:60S ribosomal subunit assembly/export protein LOC1
MAYKRKKQGNSAREIEQEVRTDNVAANLLTTKSKNYVNSQTAKVKKLPAKPGQKKEKRTYTEKELGIPKLNKSIDPEGVKRKGKKGKKFVDNTAMMRIVRSVNEKFDSDYASKLEKARQLEEIREAKRLEMEKIDQEKEEALSKKKKEIKQRKKKGKNSEDTEAAGRLSPEERNKKKVSFA